MGQKGVHSFYAMRIEPRKTTGRFLITYCGATHTPRVVTQIGLYDALDGAANGVTMRASGRLRMREVVVGGEQKP